MNGNPSMERYHRQMLLPQIGATGQQRLRLAKVLVVGAGGLGCPVLQYLVAAGIGTIGVMDDDIVSMTNLHRQVLYDMSDIGFPKAERAAARLQRLNPDVTIIPYNRRLTNKNALDIFEVYDMVVDASDNFPTRYLVNDACVLLQKPVVYGAVSKFEGQLAVFNDPRKGKEPAINYRDLFPTPPPEGEIANCAEGGVIGVLPGIIGTMQAAEVLRLIVGFGQAPGNNLVTFNLLTNEWFSWKIQPDPRSRNFLPSDQAAFLQADYGWNCGTTVVTEIDAAGFGELLKEGQVTVIDVRELTEQPVIHEFAHLRIPLATLNERTASVHGDLLVTLCQSGIRSRQAAQILATAFPGKKIFSLQGGIISYQQQLKKHE